MTAHQALALVFCLAWVVLPCVYVFWMVLSGQSEGAR